MKPPQLPRETELDRLNKLIDWYGRFKPQAGRVIQVRMTVKALKRFAKPLSSEEGCREWVYRGVGLHRLDRLEGE